MCGPNSLCSHKTQYALYPYKMISSLSNDKTVYFDKIVQHNIEDNNNIIDNHIKGQETYFNLFKSFFKLTHDPPFTSQALSANKDKKYHL